MATRLRSPMLHQRSTPSTPLTPMYIPKPISSSPVQSVLTLKNFLFLLTLSITALIWSHQFGFLSVLGIVDGPLNSGALSQHTRTPRHDFNNGPVRIAAQHLVPQSDGTSKSGTPRKLPMSAEDVTLQNGNSSAEASHRVANQDLSASSVKSDNAKPDDLSLSAHAPTLPEGIEKQSDGGIEEKLKPERDLARESIESAGVAKTDENQPAAPSNTVKSTASLRERLNFTARTAINFMHFHKTGGVSFKTSLHKFYFGRMKGDGSKVQVVDACYARQGASMDDDSVPTFMVWRCDWEPIRSLPQSERKLIDFTIGHQFWGNGAGDLLKERDLRSFTILRHPFDRKVSFYFHFFVRELGRKEADVTFDEIRDFLLFDKLTVNAELGRDLGPNYMAGRLLSDGIDGFVGNSSFRYFDVPIEQNKEIADRALNLVRNYIFVGLQKESAASKCMLRKVVEVFNEVNGVNNDGVDQIDRDAEVLNTGSYSLTASEIWGRMSPEEREIFDGKERVDLLIYNEGERLFKNQVRFFGCTDRVKNSKYLT